MRLKALVICLASGAAAAVVACGDDGGANKLPDAPLPGSDSALPDTPQPPAPARLTILQAGAPVEGVDVYFQNADSSLVAKVPTDANGIAEATVMPNAFVTVVNPFAFPVPAGVTQSDLRTYAGVQPGDRLVLTDGTPNETLTNVNVVVDEDPNGSQYKMWATCMVFFQKSSASMPYYFSVGSAGTVRPTASPDLINCPTKTDVLIESEDGLGAGVGWIFKDDVAVAAAATIDITDAYTATPSVTLEYTDAPASLFGINVQNILATSDGALWREDINLGSGATTTTYTRPAPAGATQVFVADLFVGGSSSNTLVDWMPIATAPTLSLTGSLLRQITGAGAFDATTATATWPEEATGEAPDLAIVAVTAIRKATASVWTWKIAGPVTGASLVYPTLPADIAQYNVVAGDQTSIYDVTTAKVPGGYATVRPIVLSQNLAGYFAGPSGRILVQRYFD